MKRNRSALRALDVLLALNSLGRATPKSVADAVGLPRPSVYRMLETLREAGFVQRGASGANYRLTHQVRRLSAGFEEEHWIAHIALPHMRALGHDLVWPIALATLDCTRMVVRATTDDESALALEKVAGGHVFPLASSASGHVYLAHCCDNERRELLDHLYFEAPRTGEVLPERATLLRALTRVRRLGFGLVARERRVSNLVVMAVPIIAAQRCIGTLSIRYSSGAVTERRAVEQFLPHLRRGARLIGGEYADSRVVPARSGALAP